jgi:hypothetical protein
MIVKKNGDEIKAKVEEVLSAEIKYRKFENPTGPVYSIPKADVFMIRYENGSKDVFGTQNAPVTAQPAPVYTQPAQTSKPKITADDIKPAKTGRTINYILIAPILGVGAASAFSEDETAIALGGVATAIAGIGIPIGAVISGKTRRNTGVEGYPGVRIAGWIGYGLAMADAVAMLALSGDVDFTGGPTISVAILGALSSALLAVDASECVRQAEKYLGNIEIQPVIGNVCDITGNHYNTIGIKINF